MKSATTTLLETLSQRGYRCTEARKAICEVLETSSVPLTLQAIAKAVDVDTASVYRTIRMLQAEGLLEEVVRKNGQTAYAPVTHHHHHLVCTDCDRIEHVPCLGNIKTPRHRSFAKVNEHEVTFYGLCTECA